VQNINELITGIYLNILLVDSMSDHLGTDVRTDIYTFTCASLHFELTVLGPRSACREPTGTVCIGTTVLRGTSQAGAYFELVNGSLLSFRFGGTG
jgi:hypothetical protein